MAESKPNLRHALVVESDKMWREMYTDVLRHEGYTVKGYASEQGARRYLKSWRPNIALVHFQEEMGRSLKFIQECAQQDPSLSIIYPTFYGGPDLHRRALNLGAFAVMDKLSFRLNNADMKRLLEAAYNQSLARRMHSLGAPNVFVLMPFAKRFDERYRLGIKEPLEAFGIRCERVDEMDFTGDIVEKVFLAIHEASVLVADMTGKNPNVFYEVGYAHALGKKVVLATERVADIPFDLRGQRHIVYGRSILRLREGVIGAVRDAIGLPKEPANPSAASTRAARGR